MATFPRSSVSVHCRPSRSRPLLQPRSDPEPTAFASLQSKIDTGGQIHDYDPDAVLYDRVASQSLNFPSVVEE